MNAGAIIAIVGVGCFALGWLAGFARGRFGRGWRDAELAQLDRHIRGQTPSRRRGRRLRDTS